MTKNPKSLVYALALATLRSLAAPLVVDGAFDNGRIEVVSIDQTARIITTRVPADNHQQDANMRYWHMRVSGITPGEALTLRHTPSAAIHYLFSYDGETWHRFPNSRINPLTFRFTQDTVFIAPAVPFPYGRSLALAAELGALPHVQAFDLATSEEGRAVKTLRITDPAVPDAGKRTVWIHARSHAFESHSSHVAEGFARWMASDDAAAADFRTLAIAYVTPIMDVDNVFKGMTGKDQPNDFNRVWDQNPTPWNAVNAAKAQLTALHAQGTLFAMIDSHNPPYNLTPHWYVSARTADWNRFATHYRAGVAEAGGHNRDATQIEGSIELTPTTSTHARHYSIVHFDNGTDFLSLTMESAQYKDNDGVFMTREGSQQWGEGLGRGLYKYLGGTLVQTNIPPRARIAALGGGGFSAAGSSDPENDMAAYHWDFGDGQSAVTTVPTVQHAFAAEGDYAVTLRVRDGQGVFSAPAGLIHAQNPPAPPSAWEAENQQGASNWLNSGLPAGSFRILLQGASVTNHASELSLRLRGRSSGSYTLRGVSLAKRLGATLNVDTSTWTEITFGANTWAQGVTVAANTEVASEPFDFALRPGEDLFVTFRADQGTVYLPTNLLTIAWTLPGADESARKDWEGLAGLQERGFVYAVQGLRVLASPLDDLDRDGLPDAWERHWFQGLAQDGQATTNGLKHLERFASGFPANQTDLPRITLRSPPLRLAFDTRGAAEDWYGGKQRHYQVEQNTFFLGSNGWSSASAPFIGDGNPVEVPLPTNTVERMHRLRIWLE